MRLYTFNPEHDLALANNHPNFVPPASARKMAADLGVLPAWWSRPGDGVLVAEAGRCRDWQQSVQTDFEWPELLRQHLQEIRFADVREAVQEPSVVEICPWGWNQMTASRMKQAGFAAHLIPDPRKLEQWRNLSSREGAVGLLRELRIQFRDQFPQLAGYLCGESYYCRTEEEIRMVLEQYAETILKAPWSGSGKGLRLGKGGYAAPLSGWCRRVLHDQGGVVVEPRYVKVVDFAFEYVSDGCGQLSYEGLSVFRTTHQGAYAGNWLASEQEKRGWLARYVPEQLLYTVETVLRQGLRRRVASGYCGPLGVDLMICGDRNGTYRVHPCVEVNLRMTMGLAAHRIGSWLSEGSKGLFLVDFFSDSRHLIADHDFRKRTFPALCGKDGKLLSGYIPLTPVGAESAYRACIMARPDLYPESEF